MNTFKAQTSEIVNNPPRSNFSLGNLIYLNVKFTKLNYI